MSVALSIPFPAERRRGISLAWCYAILAPAMIFIIASLDRSYQTDLWHHLARGREMWATGSIVNRDVFTYTVTGQPIVDNNWLTQLAAYKLWQCGGIDLLQAINALLLAATIGGLVAIGRALGASVRAAALVAVVAVIGLSNLLLIRPQTVSMVLFVGVYALLVRARTKPKSLWWIPAIISLWSNVHGAFPIGVVLVGVFAVAGFLRYFTTIKANSGCHRPQYSETRAKGRTSAQVSEYRDLWHPDKGNIRLLVVVLLLSALATLANPYGFHVYQYVLTTSSRATMRVVEEWQRPNVFSLSGAIWVASLLATAVLAYVRRSRLTPWMVLSLVGFGILSFTSVRMSIWWYLSAAPIVMMLCTNPAPARFQPSSFGAVFFAIILAATVMCLPALEQWNPIFKFRSSARPDDNLAELASAIASAEPHARVFSRLEWGEYLSFALPWKQSIFMDGRVEIYPDSLWRDYGDITGVSPDWQTLLDRYGVTVLLLDRHYHDGLIAAATNSPHWRKLTTIGGGVIFVRSSQ